MEKLTIQNVSLNAAIEENATIEENAAVGAAIENSTQLCSSIAALLMRRRSRRATAAAAGGRTSCRTSQNLAAIGALLYNPWLGLQDHFQKQVE